MLGHLVSNGFYGAPDPGPRARGWLTRFIAFLFRR